MTNVTWRRPRFAPTLAHAEDWRKAARTKGLFADFEGDDSMKVQERAASSLAQSGIPSRVERMKAVPGLIELADDPTLNDQTRNWVYQALREITGQRLPNDTSQWRLWYERHGQETAERFAAADGNQVVGNG